MPITVYLIVCPLVFVGGLVDAIAGGGGLITLPAYMIAGLPVHNAIATNKLANTMGTSLATARYGMAGYIPWKQVPFCVACAYAGSTLGSWLALQVSDRSFRILMLIVLPLTAAYVLRHKSLSSSRTPFSFGKTTVISIAISLAIGTYDGFYGPGTGTFLILLLTAAARMELTKANGLTKAVNLASNAAALVVFLINGKALIPLGLCAGCFNLAGNYVGSGLFRKNGARFVRPVMILVLVIFFIKVLYELVTS
ncbi:MAG: TSUP family transporter [Oscillospiraceae bacterium]|nr:TSUP family transporter [Oscillospiraceae bacterium]